MNGLPLRTLIAGIFFVLWAGTAAAETVGTLEVKMGEATVTRTDGRVERLVGAAFLPYNVGVETSKDGRAFFVLPSGTIRIDPETSLFAPTKDRINLKGGTIRLEVYGGPSLIVEAGGVLMETGGVVAEITFRPPDGLRLFVTSGGLEIKVPKAP